MGEVYRSSDTYIERELAKAKTDQATARLVLDIADILTGPTSGHNALYLAECMARHAKELAERMKEIADRYLSATASQEDTPQQKEPLAIKLWVYVENYGDGSAGVRFFNEKKEAEEKAEKDNERFTEDVFSKTIKVDENGKLV